jgi:ankyrin repeat protein
MASEPSAAERTLNEVAYKLDSPVTRRFVMSLRGMSLEARSRKMAVFAQQGLGEAARLMLAHGADIDARFENDYTALHLHWAAQAGAMQSLQALLESGADLHLVARGGLTALHVATEARHAEAVTLLLRYGATVDAADDRGLRPLFIALRKSDAACCAALVQAGADVDARFQGIPLQYAIQNGSAAIVRTLCEAGAQLHNVIKDGCTPLGAAASLGKHEVVIELLARGADPNKGVDDGRSPLSLAIEKGHAACVEALAPVSDMLVKDKTGMTALHVLAVAGATAKLGDECVCSLLSRTGAAFEIKSADGFTPLAMAVLKKDVACIRLLAEAGADVNASQLKGCTPLILSAQEGSCEAIRALLELGAKAKAAAHDGLTPLMMAAQECHTDCIEALGPFSNRDAQTREGLTAIHYALSGPLAAKRSAALASLLAFGCDRFLMSAA